MKKTICIALMMVTVISIFSQQTPSVKTDYLQKSKNQKTGAWVLLGGGFSVLAVTAATNAGVDFQNKKSFPIVPVCIGGAMMIGSIPLFIASGKNKRKANAATTFFKMETMPVIQQHSLVQHPYPAISVKIGL